MRRRRLPGTELLVSEVGFGLWSVEPSWWGTSATAQIERLVQKAFDCGITLFDTADVVGKGLAENILGRALSGHRWELTLATKGGYEFTGSTALGPGAASAASPDTAQGEERIGSPQQDWWPESLRRSCEASLRRLATETIDLYQLHHPGFEILEREEVWQTLARLKKEGKIREYGVSLGTASEGSLEEGARKAIAREGNRSLQLRCSILEQEPARSIAPEAERQGCALLVREPHAFGLLDGPSAGALRESETELRGGSEPRRLEEGKIEKAKQELEALRFLEEGRSRNQAAILFALAQPAVAAVLPWISSSAEIDEFAAASDLAPLSREELDRIEDLWQSRLSRLELWKMG